MRRNAFTLAELLIALGILGVIATFTIPKVIGTMEDRQRKSVIKEAVASISQIVYEGYIQRALTVDNYTDYVLARLNAVKVCPSDSEAEGCWNNGVQPHIPNHSDYPGVILHNGAYLVSLYAYDIGGGVHCSGQYIDWNGTKGPNIIGQDIVEFISSFGVLDTDPGSWCYDIKPGTIQISWSDDDIWE